LDAKGPRKAPRSPGGGDGKNFWSALWCACGGQRKSKRGGVFKGGGRKRGQGKRRAGVSRWKIGIEGSGVNVGVWGEGRERWGGEGGGGAGEGGKWEGCE